ncbi:MAG: Wzz/FepE/Etk N-terminal domain-containing protein [Planctomycetes bacterium]|jgi:uncharacterized protein involved in exopolysaccharide biosynthesis|nr:Wzz/FepE/Etk N-terminal domain-containing protein [Planctomycetota bacterium]
MADSQGKPQQPVPTQCAVDDEIDLLDYLRVIWRYRWLIALLCLLAMSAAVALSLSKPRQYQATVTVVPPLDVLQKEAGGGLGAMSNPLIRQMIDTTTASIAGMYVEILESREVADAIIDHFRLMEVYEKIEYRADARKQLQNNTRVETTEGGAVKVTVLDLDPSRAAAIAGGYIEELDKQNKRLSAGQATSKRVFLENRLKEIEVKLSKIDNLLSREAQTQERIYAILLEQCELAKIEEAKSMPTIQVLDAPVVPERGVARGTVRKGVLAGIAASMLGIFLAFAREYVMQARRREGAALSRSQPRPNLAHQHNEPCQATASAR